MTHSELLGESIPDAENTAAGLRDVAERLGGDANRIANLVDPYFAGVVTDETRRSSEAALADQAATLGAIDAALARPRYRSLLSEDDFRDPAIGALLRQVERARSVARLLSLASLTAIDSDPTAASARVLAELRHAVAIEREPSLTSAMVTYAVQGMAMHSTERLIATSRPSEAEAIDAALALIEDTSSLRWALESERVLTLRRLEAMPLRSRILMRPGELRLYDEALAAADGPLERLAERGQSLLTRQRTFPSLATPAIVALMEAKARVGLQARGLRDELRKKRAQPAD